MLVQVALCGLSCSLLNQSLWCHKGPVCTVTLVSSQANPSARCFLRPLRHAFVALSPFTKTWSQGVTLCSSSAVIWSELKIPLGTVVKVSRAQAAAGNVYVNVVCNVGHACRICTERKHWTSIAPCRSKGVRATLKVASLESATVYNINNSRNKWEEGISLLLAVWLDILGLLSKYTHRRMRKGQLADGPARGMEFKKPGVAT